MGATHSQEKGGEAKYEFTRQVWPDGLKALELIDQVCGVAEGCAIDLLEKHAPLIVERCAQVKGVRQDWVALEADVPRLQGTQLLRMATALARLIDKLERCNFSIHRITQKYTHSNIVWKSLRKVAEKVLAVLAEVEKEHRIFHYQFELALYASLKAQGIPLDTLRIPGSLSQQAHDPLNDSAFPYSRTSLSGSSIAAASRRSNPGHSLHPGTSMPHSSRISNPGQPGTSGSNSWSRALLPAPPSLSVSHGVGNKPDLSTSAGNQLAPGVLTGQAQESMPEGGAPLEVANRWAAQPLPEPSADGQNPQQHAQQQQQQDQQHGRQTGAYQSDIPKQAGRCSSPGANPLLSARSQQPSQQQWQQQQQHQMPASLNASSPQYILMYAPSPPGASLPDASLRSDPFGNSSFNNSNAQHQYTLVTAQQQQSPSTRLSSIAPPQVQQYILVPAPPATASPGLLNTSRSQSQSPSHALALQRSPANSFRARRTSFVARSAPGPVSATAGAAAAPSYSHSLNSNSQIQKDNLGRTLNSLDSRLAAVGHDVARGDQSSGGLVQSLLAARACLLDAALLLAHSTPSPRQHANEAPSLDTAMRLSGSLKYNDADAVRDSKSWLAGDLADHLAQSQQLPAFQPDFSTSSFGGEGRLHQASTQLHLQLSDSGTASQQPATSRATSNKPAEAHLARAESLLAAAESGDMGAVTELGSLLRTGGGCSGGSHHPHAGQPTNHHRKDSYNPDHSSGVDASGSGQPLTSSWLGVSDPVVARGLLQHAAAAGEAEAAFVLGEMAEKGEGLAGGPDYAAAAEHYHRAAKLGSKAGLACYAYLLEHGRGVLRDEARAARLYVRAANAGNATATNNLGKMMFDGRAMEANRPAAARLFRKAADGGSAAAHYNLGMCYVEGLGVPQDEHAAVQCFTQAAVMGHPRSALRLANAYLAQGSYARAYGHLSVASAAGLRDAVFALAQLAERQAGLLLRSLDHALSVADQELLNLDFSAYAGAPNPPKQAPSITPSHDRLDLSYLLGLSNAAPGTSPSASLRRRAYSPNAAYASTTTDLDLDPWDGSSAPSLPHGISREQKLQQAQAAAAKLYSQAATAGDPRAIHWVGNLQWPSRPDAALQCYYSAARQGYAPSLALLGHLAEGAQGFQQDLPTARACYRLAAAKGHANAEQHLARVEAALQHQLQLMNSSADSMGPGPVWLTKQHGPIDGMGQGRRVQLAF